MHILATDDEQSALNVLMGAIKEAVPMATVQGFRNPLEALAFMEENNCDVVFLFVFFFCLGFFFFVLVFRIHIQQGYNKPCLSVLRQVFRSKRKQEHLKLHG